MNDANPSLPRIGLALSGGGFRAAVFHLGVLRSLAERGLLESVHQVSTVSGGSLLVGALLRQSGGQWPTSRSFLADVFPAMRTLFTTRDLLSFRSLGVAGVVRWHGRILYHRAKILAWSLERNWEIDGRLADLPASPTWHINTTCFETGKNWRFSRTVMGDWKFGRHYAPDVALADAMAASAAVPYAIGALTLELPEDGWVRSDPATGQPLDAIKPSSKHVRLWDGGAYENMALEPLYKPSEGLRNCDFIICSDASAPLLEPKAMLGELAKGRLGSPRLFDIASDQIRSLRSRMLMQAIQKREVQGALVRMGAPSAALAGTSARELLTSVQCKDCHEYPTTLKRVPEARFDLIARHGEEIADLTMRVAR